MVSTTGAHPCVTISRAAARCSVCPEHRARPVAEGEFGQKGPVDEPLLSAAEGELPGWIE